MFYIKVALVTAKHMLSMCKASASNEGGSPSIEHTDNRSIFQLYTTEHSDKDSSKVFKQLLINCIKKTKLHIE